MLLSMLWFAVWYFLFISGDLFKPKQADLFLFLTREHIENSGFYDSVDEWKEYLGLKLHSHKYDEWMALSGCHPLYGMLKSSLRFLFSAVQC
jgi:hypothetical protein